MLFFLKIFTFLICVSLQNFSYASSEAASFSPSLTWAESKLVLNGTGWRRATILRVRVYEAALYLSEKNQSPNAILDSTKPKLLQMRFARAVAKKDLEKAWTDAFKKNCNPMLCEHNRENKKKFLALIEDAKKDELYTYAFYPEGNRLEIHKDGLQMGEITANQEFLRLILLSWLGPYPPNEDLKKGLLAL